MDENQHVAESAKAAGIRSWIVPGGATGLESAADAGPDLVLTSFEELLQRIPRPA